MTLCVFTVSVYRYSTTRVLNGEKPDFIRVNKLLKTSRDLFRK